MLVSKSCHTILIVSGFQEWDVMGLHPDIMDVAVTLIKGLFKFASIPVELSISSLDKSFFDLGGYSSNAVILLVHLNRKGYAVSKWWRMVLNKLLHHEKCLMH
jgi:hypothetical protein